MMTTEINDDRVLDARDMAEEIAAGRRVEDAFANVLNQWTDTLLEENRKANDPATIALILRLGTLGQRLIYQANQLGMRYTLEELRNA